MVHGKDEAALRAWLEALRREPVVSLASVRRLHLLLRDLTNAKPELRLIAAVQAAIAESQLSTAGWLLDRVERVLDGMEVAPVVERAGLIARDEDFRRISRLIRRSRAQFGALSGDGEEIPFVEVGPHVRQGRPVRGYSRYVGYEHLRALPGLVERPEAVQQVIRCLIDGRHRRRV